MLAIVQQRYIIVEAYSILCRMRRGSVSKLRKLLGQGLCRDREFHLPKMTWKTAVTVAVTFVHVRLFYI